jgi:predicted exporter
VLGAILPTTIAPYGTRELLAVLAVAVAVVGMVQIEKWGWRRTLLVSGGALAALAWIIPLPEGFTLSGLGLGA